MKHWEGYEAAPEPPPIRLRTKTISDGEVYFGADPAWDRSREPEGGVKGVCPLCKGDLGPFRYCPCCSAVQPTDQAKLDAQPFITFPPDKDVLEAYAEAVEVRHSHWSEVPEVDDRQRGDEALMTDLDDRTRAAVLGSQKSRGVARQGQAPTRRERRAHLQRRSA